MESTIVVDMRKRIIEAAISVAARSGFTMATTKEIAEEAGCSEGIIYHYFESKRELFSAVIKEKAEEFLKQLRQEVSSVIFPIQKLERLIENHFHYFTGKAHIFQVLFGKSGDTMIPFPYILKVIILPYQKIIENILNEGITAGDFAETKSVITATSILGLMQLNIIKAHFGVHEAPILEVKQTVKKLILRAVLKEGRIKK
jgi:AcrR family transcriptional regulator